MVVNDVSQIFQLRLLLQQVSFVLTWAYACVFPEISWKAPNTSDSTSEVLTFNTTAESIQPLYGELPERLYSRKRNIAEYIVVRFC